MSLVTYNNRYRGVDVHYYDGSGNPCHAAKINGSVVRDPATAGRELDNSTVCDLIQSDVFLLGILQTPTVISDVPYDGNASTNPSFHFPEEYCPRG